MRSWNNGRLGVVGTIYEEEPEDLTSNSKGHSLTASPVSTSSSPTLPASSSSASPSSLLKTRVEEWSRMTGLKPDVKIRVHDQCFNLHKEPLASHSRYLRHRLLVSSSIDVPLPLPSPAAADTFTLVAAFSYGAELPITPSNVAALHVAAEFLQMVSDAAHPNDLLERSDWYFRQSIAAGAKCATMVLCTCLGLISSAGGAAALLAGRCLESLAGGRGEEKAWATELALAAAEEFQMIAASMRARHVENHDILYEIVDRYLECRGGELTDDEKNRICSAVDCRKLTRPRLVGLVQNPRMPLRFVVQAILIEQFQTHATVVNGISRAAPSDTVTLGDVLQREAAVRQVENLRDAMTATSFRIKSLEEELATLRRMLKEEDGVGSERRRRRRSRARSSSFRLHKEEKREEKEEEEGDGSSSTTVGEWKGRRGFGRMVVNGIARVLRGTWRVEVGSLSCRWGGDVVRAEELTRNHPVV